MLVFVFRFNRKLHICDDNRMQSAVKPDKKYKNELAGTCYVNDPLMVVLMSSGLDAIDSNTNGFDYDNDAVCPARDSSPLPSVAHDSETLVLCKDDVVFGAYILYAICSWRIKNRVSVNIPVVFGNVNDIHLPLLQYARSP